MEGALFRLALAIFIGLAVSCGDAVPGRDVSLAPYAASVVPLSEDPNMRLVSERTLCTRESYEYRIYCTDVSGTEVSSFGRQGEGPGEFRNAAGALVRGPHGTIGVIDTGLSRMSLFSLTGTLLSETRLPTGFVLGSTSFSSTLAGSWTDFAPGGVTFRHTELDMGSGEVVWDKVYPSRLGTDAGCESMGDWEGLIGGAFSTKGGIVFSLCRGQLLFFTDRDDPSGTLVRAPRYVSELPTEEDVNAYLERAGPFAMEDRFRRTPKRYLRGRAVFDGQGRLWALTNRDLSDGFSYLDVYEGPEYLGAVRVRHHALAIDLLGSTLAVLVDRPVGARDPDGFPDRGVDWYEIGDLGFGEQQDR